MSREPPPPLRIEGVETSFQRKGLAGWIGWASLVALILPIVLLMVLGRSLSTPICTALGLMTLSSPALMLTALALRVFHWRRPGSIAVAGERLVLSRDGAERSFPLADLVAGHLRPGERTVTLTRAGGDLVHVRVPRVEDGQRLLAATGLDASRRAMRLRLGERFFLDFVTLSLAPGIFAAATHRAGGFAVVLTLALTFGLWRVVRELLGPAEIIVGADGIIVRQRFASRFLAFGSIASIDRVPDTARVGDAGIASLTGPLTLHLTDGTTVEARTRHLSAEERDQLAGRIEEAQAAWSAGAAGATALAPLDRNGRAVVDWRAAMRQLLVAPEGYRAQAVTRDALVDVLESPAAPVERRLAAAMALAHGEDGDGRTRIRVVAEACADERVRVALRQAADGDLDERAVDDALAATKAERQPPLRSTA